ncbi:hypothetical protein [Streptococcus parauberis]|uniref:hypothetical protein n=1 Tax=Streptococcus parauberis TaxID=1348 RepID=UPI000789BB92|nr:hypothetical protein [Streptococcus parauberis]QBX18191.1 hypothetical protein Javan399_0051 [Streptococcus phage Javan399]KYP20822.1 hypothetical protein AKL13_00441 [Streptococcus parauberis]KYP21206.1 hypothetical protein TN39_00364 [Streptococcus parauberis]KYP22398.1 hypothetical protein AKL14_00398 [Streptococcus parauberis]KYP24865.1 hypothetical protein ADO04_01148 [Streptococcus parauberis]
MNQTEQFEAYSAILETHIQNIDGLFENYCQDKFSKEIFKAKFRELVDKKNELVNELVDEIA